MTTCAILFITYHTSKPTHKEIIPRTLNFVHMYRVPLLTSASDTFEVYQNLRKNVLTNKVSLSLSTFI